MDKRYYIGIDIGSTASKVVVIDDEKLIDSFVYLQVGTAKKLLIPLCKNLKKMDSPIICPVPQQVTAGYA